MPIPSAMTRHRAAAVLAAALMFAAAAPPARAAGPAPMAWLDARLDKLVEGGRVLVADRERTLYSYGEPDKLLPPASVLKYLTALVALERLGEGHRFATEVFLTPGGGLLVRGRGDPNLVSERLAELADALVATGRLPDPVRGLALDDSLFDLPAELPGVAGSTNPYDARVGALVANFNTVNVRVAENGAVSSAEPQTPLTPLAAAVGRGLAPGEHRVNVSREPARVREHFAQLFRAFLERAGVRVEGGVVRRAAGPGDAPLLRYENPTPLRETVGGMMRYSNNFVANQLMLAAGMEAGGPPATAAKGVALLADFMERRIGEAPGAYVLEEGSGLSRGNLVRAEAVLEWVRAFEPHRALLGQTRGVDLKTGTLTGVYTMAGYLDHPGGARHFVIMLRQKRNTRAEILDLLKRAEFPAP